MSLARRRCLQLAGSAAAVPALPHFAAALDDPARPVRFVVGLAAGSGLDIKAE